MKNLTFKLVLPLTIISFALITKWWYALPVDAPDTLFTGFPFPFECEGWHTSLSLQIFVTEFILDFLIYFLFWFTLLFCVHRFCIKIHPQKMLPFVLWTLSGLIISVAILIASNSDHVFYLKRPFEMEVMQTGYKFNWQVIERPDYYQYHPEQNNPQK